MTQGSLTLVSADRGHLAKTYTLRDGKLTKATAAQLTSGTFEVACFDDLQSLAGIIGSIGHHQAVMTGTAAGDATTGRIVTKASKAHNPGAIARTREDIEWREGQAGALCFDIDTGGVTPGDVLAMLDEMGFLGGGVLVLPSGSSHIWDRDRNVELQGLSGFHLWVLVLDCSDIARVILAVFKRLWLKGRGTIEVSASGAMLERTLIDAAVAQPERLLFEGGSVCEPPLEQRRGKPVILRDGGFLDTRRMVPDLTPEEEATYQALVTAARERKAPEAAAQREVWKAGRMVETTARLVRAGELPRAAEERARHILGSALDGVLFGDFEVETPDGVRVTVAQLLDDPKKWHGVDLRDPLEPGRRGGAPCAKPFLLDGRPTIHSFGRGGSTFRLVRRPERFEVAAGERSILVSRLLSFVGRQPDLYMRGGQLVVMD